MNEQPFAPFPYTAPDNSPEIHANTIGTPLALTLAATVPFLIHDLVAGGGPTDYQREQAIANGQIAMQRADYMLYGDKKGEPAKLFAYLAEAIAVLAFVPGGITIFGQHYEAHVRAESDPPYAPVEVQP